MKKIANIFSNIGLSLKKKWLGANHIIKHANGKTASSFLVMGLGQLLNKQIAKGMLFLLTQVGALLYFFFKGAKDFLGFFSLGSVQANPWKGIKGDNSVVMLILGVLSIFAIAFYIVMYVANIKDAYATQLRIENGEAPLRFKQEVSQLLNKKFYVTTLFVPIIGVLVFNVLPIIFMILIAFTNYNKEIVETGALMDWVGFDNFKKIISLGDFASTFFKILGWNFVWAILSTAINYFGGLGLALLINKAVVKHKTLWRAFPLVAFAVPGFITLLAFKFLFSYGGPINQILADNNMKLIGFLDLDAGWRARAVGIFVNAWISIPSSMLLATGILSNSNKDIYEAATIDGASRFKQFKSITLPYVLFATTPVLISQFIGNFNNFGIFYFLRGGLYIDGYFLASDTDLLINWLYNLSIDNNYYSIGAAISLVIFIITSIISLIVYVTSPAYKQEDTYK